MTGGRADLLVDCLTYCDVTTGPDGEVVTLEKRLQEIEERYFPQDVVSRAIRRATPALRSAHAQVFKTLAEGER